MNLIVSDVDSGKRHLAEQLEARWISSEDAHEADVDVLVPCALGGFLNEETVPRLRSPVIAGAANNQLADDGVADLLAARGILWAPDFVVNSGGLINVAEELGGYDPADARRRTRGIAETLQRIFAEAASKGTTPLMAAMELAGRRLAS
jgi:leucine dehydrogenase